MHNSSNLRIYDYTNVRSGTILKRSRHWMKEHFDTNTKQLGILVDKEFYSDAKGNVICWPVIRWEGSASDSITHPVNAVPFRTAKYNKNNFIIMSE